MPIAPPARASVVHELSSSVAVCWIVSLFVQPITSPTFAWIGSGENLKSLIVTLTVAVPPVGATAHAAPAADPAGAEASGAEAAVDGAVDGGAAADEAVGVAPPPQA